MRERDVKTIDDLMNYALERERRPERTQDFSNRGVDWQSIRKHRERRRNGLV